LGKAIADFLGIFTTPLGPLDLLCLALWAACHPAQEPIQKTCSNYLALDDSIADLNY